MVVRKSANTKQNLDVGRLDSIVPPDGEPTPSPRAPARSPASAPAPRHRVSRKSTKKDKDMDVDQQGQANSDKPTAQTSESAAVSKAPGAHDSVAASSATNVAEGTGAAVTNGERSPSPTTPRTPARNRISNSKVKNGRGFSQERSKSKIDEVDDFEASKRKPLTEAEEYELFKAQALSPTLDEADEVASPTSPSSSKRSRSRARISRSPSADKRAVSIERGASVSWESDKQVQDTSVERIAEATKSDSKINATDKESADIKGNVSRLVRASGSSVPEPAPKESIRASGSSIPASVSEEALPSGSGAAAAKALSSQSEPSTPHRRDKFKSSDRSFSSKRESSRDVEGTRSSQRDKFRSNGEEIGESPRREESTGPSRREESVGASRREESTGASRREESTSRRERFSQRREPSLGASRREPSRDPARRSQSKDSSRFQSGDGRASKFLSQSGAPPEPECTVPFTGSQHVDPDELKAIQQLGEVKFCEKVELLKVPGWATKQITPLFMCPLAREGQHMPPTILKVGTVEAIQYELQGMRSALAAFGQFVPRPVDFTKDLEKLPLSANAVLQLEFSGGRCCLPRFTKAIQTIDTCAALMEKVVSDFPEFDGEYEKIDYEKYNQSLQSSFFAGTQTLFKEILLKSCAVQTGGREIDFWDTCALCGLVRDQVLEVDCVEYEMEFFNGEGMGAILGGPKVNEMILELVGQSCAPSEVFESSAAYLSQQQLKFYTSTGCIHGDLHLGNVLQDMEGKAWITSFNSIQEDGCVFTDLARWLCEGLFLHGPPTTDQDEADLRRLLKVIASVPDLSYTLPDCDDDLSHGVKFRWDFARRMLRFATAYATPPAGSRKPDRPELQVLVLILSEALSAVVSSVNRASSRQKRLALFGALAISIRLRSEFGCPRPEWLPDHRSLWVAEDSCVGSTHNSMSRRRYLGIVGAREAWVVDPFTRLRFSVLKETVDIEIRGRVGSSQSYEELMELLIHQQRLVVVGPAGSGKTIQTRQLVAHAVEEQLDDQVSGYALSKFRLPVRIPLIELAHLAENAEKLEEVLWFSKCYEEIVPHGWRLVTREEAESPAYSMTVGQMLNEGDVYRLSDDYRIDGSSGKVYHVMEKELDSIDDEEGWRVVSIIVRGVPKLLETYLETRLGTEERAELESNRADGWLITLDGVDETAAHKEKFLVWLEHFLETEQQHQVLLTTRPSAIEVDKERGVGVASTDAVLSLEWLNRMGFAILDVKPFSEEQLTRLCDRRLSAFPSGDRFAILLRMQAPQHKSLVSTPLMATMLMHFVAHMHHRGVEYDISRTLVYDFAFPELLHRSTRCDGELLTTAPAKLENIVMKLCFEKQGVRKRSISKKDLLEIGGRDPSLKADLKKLWTLAANGQVAFFDVVGGNFLQVFHLTMQEYLAAKYAWNCIDDGGDLPEWLGHEGSGNDFAVGSGKFFGELAIQRAGLMPKRVGELRKKGLDAVLRNLLRAGHCESLTGLFTLPKHDHDKETLIKSMNIDSQTAVQYASMKGFESVLRCLLGYFKKENLQGALELAGGMPGSTVAAYSALQLAASGGHVDTLCTLLELAPDPHKLIKASSRDGGTVLHSAVKGPPSRREDMTRTILEMTKAQDKQSLLCTQDRIGNTPLHIAASEGYEEVISVFLMLAPDRQKLLKVQNQEGKAPVHLSAANGHCEATKTLLQMAANDEEILYLRDNDQCHPFRVALRGGHIPCAKLLYGMDLDKGNALFDELTEAMEAKVPQLLTSVKTLLLLTEGNDDGQGLLETQNWEGYTVLHIALMKKRIEKARALLDVAPNGFKLLIDELHVAISEKNGPLVGAVLELAPDRHALVNEEFIAAARAANRSHMRILLEHVKDKEKLFTQALHSCVCDDLKTSMEALITLIGGDAIRYLVEELKFAVIQDRKKTVQMLIEVSPDREEMLMAQAKDGQTPLHNAVCAGNGPIASLVLDWAPNPHKLIMEELHRCVLEDNALGCKTLLGLLPDEHKLLSEELHSVIRLSNPDAVKFVLNLTSEPQQILEATREDATTALQRAAIAGHDGVIRILMDFATDAAELFKQLHGTEGTSVLHLAIQRGHVAASKTILEIAPNPQWLLQLESRQKHTALHDAAVKGREETVRLLLEHAPDRQKLLMKGGSTAKNTPLHLAAETGRTDSARALLELAPNKQALLEAANQAGSSALHLAVLGGQEAVIHTLLEKAPDAQKLLEMWDPVNGMPLLHLAVYKGHVDIARSLMQHAPDRKRLLEMKDKDGHIALYHAACDESEAAARALLELAPERQALLDIMDKDPLVFIIKDRWEKHVKLMSDLFPEEDSEPCSPPSAAAGKSMRSSRASVQPPQSRASVQSLQLGDSLPSPSSARKSATVGKPARESLAATAEKPGGARASQMSLMVGKSPLPPVKDKKASVMNRTSTQGL